MQRVSSIDEKKPHIKCIYLLKYYYFSTDLFLDKYFYFDLNKFTFRNRYCSEWCAA